MDNNLPNENIDFSKFEPLTPKAEPQAVAPEVGAPEEIDFSKFEPLQEKYGAPLGIARTAAESLLEGVIGPIAPAAERMAGVSPEEIRLHQEANPITSGLFKTLGFVAPMGIGKAVKGARALGLTELATVLPEVRKLTQLGVLEAAGAKIAPFAGETLAGRLGNAGARNFVEGAIFGGMDETSKMILNDPHQSADTAVSGILLSGAFMSALGVGGAVVKEGVSKAGKLAADMKGTFIDHLENPNRVEAMTKELQEYYDNIRKIADEVYGPSGLKAQDIEKALPAMHEGMTAKIAEIDAKLNKAIDSLESDPHQKILIKAVEDWRAEVGLKPLNMAEEYMGVSRPTPSPVDIFSSTEKLKQRMQELGRYNKNLVPVLERPLRNAAKDVGHEIRVALEDAEVWGKAGERQKAINAAFKEYLPKLQDFEKRFMAEVAEEKIVNPARVETYLNQLGESKAEIKEQVLKNFLDATEEYKQVIEKTHANLGMESPVVETPLKVTKNSLKEMSHGEKIARTIINKALTDTGSAALAAGIGAKAGGLLGVTREVGAILGVGVLSPLIKSVLPSVVRAVVEKEVSGAGLKAAVTYAEAVSKGRYLISNGFKNLFRPNVRVLPEYAMPTKRDRDQLEKRLQEVRQSPNKLINQDDKLMHYMPGSSQAMKETLGRASSYLDSLRPDSDPKAPLDPKPVVSAARKSEYENALDIANQPAFVLAKIKEGTLTAKDIQHLDHLYPALAQSMRKELMEQVIDQVSKNKPIPYKTKVSISMFLNQPMDSTMTPLAFQNIQAPMSPKSGGVQPQMPDVQTKKGRPSAPALQKMPGLYQTGGQSRLLRKNKL